MDGSEEPAGSDPPAEAGQETEDPAGPGTSTLNLYATLGLSPEDVDALAQIPENEISVETLPYLIMQLKAKRAKQAAQEEAPPAEEPQAEGADAADEHADGSPAAAEQAQGKGESRKRAWSKRVPRGSKAGRESQPRFPLSYQVEDFHGSVPKAFPHTCSLCSCMVNSGTTWKEHLNGLRHAEGRRDLLRVYPDFERQDALRKISSPFPGEDDPARGAPGLSGPYRRPYSSERSLAEPRLPGERLHHLKPKAGTKVVVTKFPLGSVGVEDLLALAKPFGTVVKHLVFPCKGFLEFDTHKEAVNMVNHFAEKPAFVKENKLTLYLSPVVGSIHTPRLKQEKRPGWQNNAVVCFSRVPVGKDGEEEVLELARMFGNVRRSKFSGDQAQIEMVNWKDADIMVKYYHSNPLKMNGKGVKVSISHQPLKESPGSTPPRRGDISKSSGSRHKTDAKASPSASKGKAASQALPRTEELGEKEGGSDLDNGDAQEEGAQVEDGQSSMDEPSGPEAESHAQRGSPRPGEEEADQSAPPDPSPGPEDVSAREGSVEEEEEEEQGSNHKEHVEDVEEMDFPENMEDFVTLDELDDNSDEDSNDTMDPTEGGRVVVVKPIRRGYGLEDVLLKLAEPFGRVINQAISFCRQEALMELESADAAHEMVRFYRESKKAQIFGRHVTVSISLSIERLEGASGRSIYIGMLPFKKYSDISLLKLAQPFGKITAYHLNWHHRKCYIQMESVEAAERMVQKYLHRPPNFYGSLLRICLYKKGDSQIPWKTPLNYEPWSAQRKTKRPHEDEDPKGESDQAAKSPTGSGHKRVCRESPASDSEAVCGDPGEEVEAGGAASPSADREEQEEEVQLGPFQPDTPVGVDYVVQRTGFFCKLCNVFYTSEKTAKSVHCSTLAHYQNLKRTLEEQKPLKGE